MIKLYTTFCLFFVGSLFYAQETLTFSNYNGSAINLTATTSTVNNSITIVFEDADIINNFYTQFQNEIYMFGGLNTDAGGFQGSPSFSDLGSQPQLTLIDSDNSVQPNTYSITINLAQHYTLVPNGTMVYGFNLLFQNQYSGGGNNQTLDLYIDLVDAVKDSTLSIDDFTATVKAKCLNNNLQLTNYTGPLSITIFDINGRIINTLTDISNSNIHNIRLNLPKSQLCIVHIKGDSFVETLKTISK